LIGGLSKVTRQYCGLCWVMDSLDVLGMVCSLGRNRAKWFRRW
jgi:hypothetical protein